MSAPVRLRLSRAKGFDLQALSLATNGLPAVNVARPSAWGNPFVVGKDGTRKDCVAWFILMLDGAFLVAGTPKINDMRAYRVLFLTRRAVLHGHNLACWCALPKPGEPDLCHAAALLAMVNCDTPADRRAALRPICEAVFAEVQP